MACKKQLLKKNLWQTVQVIVGFSNFPPLSSIQFSSRVSGKSNTFVEVYFIKFLNVSHFFLKENIFSWWVSTTI